MKPQLLVFLVVIAMVIKLLAMIPIEIYVLFGSICIFIHRLKPEAIHRSAFKTMNRNVALAHSQKMITIDLGLSPISTFFLLT